MATVRDKFLIIGAGYLENQRYRFLIAVRKIEVKVFAIFFNKFCCDISDPSL